ncbi:hypothetical protein Tco_0641011 [Tanacetum coccineum]
MLTRVAAFYGASRWWSVGAIVELRWVVCFAGVLICWGFAWWLHSIVVTGLELVITEYLVNISKRRAFWSLNEDILKITILETNTPYPSRKIRRIRACTHQRPQRKEVPAILRKEFTDALGDDDDDDLLDHKLLEVAVHVFLLKFGFVDIDPALILSNNNNVNVQGTFN